MATFWKYLTYVVATLILTISFPIFILYGIAEALSRFFKGCINAISENPLSRYLIAKTASYTVLASTEDE